MKTVRRHELQTNTLADWLGTAIEDLKPYVKTVVGTALALGVLVGFYFVMRNRSVGEKELGWNAFFQAATSPNPSDLEPIAKAYAGTDVGYWSSLMLADQQLNDGIDQLFVDRAAANDALQSAVENYKAAAEADQPLLQQRAHFGLARAYESQKHLDDARAEYQLVIDRWPDGMYYKAAQDRLDDLSEKPTKEFYDWFAQHKPSPRKSQFGEPDDRQPFEIGPDDATGFELPDRIDVPASSLPPGVESGVERASEEGGAPDDDPAAADPVDGASDPATGEPPPADLPPGESGPAASESAPPAEEDEPAAGQSEEQPQ